MREKETVVLKEVFWSVEIAEETANLRESQTQIAALFTRILSAYRGCGRAAV